MRPRCRLDPPPASPRGRRQHSSGGALSLAVVAALSVLGCALTSKSDAIATRYFNPERSGPIEARGPAPAGLAAELRLGHVTAASYLDERIVFRDSAFELGYYQEKRWTEAPEEYLRRRLQRALFEERGLRHVVGGSAPTLEVELTAFEEIRKPERIARVQVNVRLQDTRLVRWEESLTVDRPVAATGEPGHPDEMVDALGLALVEIVGRIAERVTTELTTSAAPRDTAPDRVR